MARIEAGVSSPARRFEIWRGWSDEATTRFLSRSRMWPGNWYISPNSPIPGIFCEKSRSEWIELATQWI